jgi:4-carboxymuconolactone decarboxylase
LASVGGSTLTGGPPVTNIRNTSSPHWRMWLRPESRCLIPANSFAEHAPEPNPETKKKDVVWFAQRGPTVIRLRGHVDDLQGSGSSMERTPHSNPLPQGEKERTEQEERSMDDQKRRDDGMTQRRKVLGDAWVDKSIANRNSFNTDFQDLITRYAWGDIWTRPHFDHRTRRVLVIGTMVALGQWDEFRLHVRAALTEGGFTPDDIKEILLQQAIYCGVPAANHAVKEASAIVAELGLLKG